MKQRHCPKCHNQLDQEFSHTPDPCLGFLPGVSHACCGHGSDWQAYVVIGGEPNESVLNKDIIDLRGKDALNFFNLIRGSVRRDGKYT